MFLRSSSRPQAVDCFFCLSPSLLPPPPAAGLGTGSGWKGKAKAEVGTKWNWHCERCGCWNVRDERGEMVSELPAMRTPTMNSRSFELRAKPSTSHLPSSTAASPFCHICLTNQTLIMNMLANYLPDENDRTYPSLYADLPNYLAGVHTRYPPVCANCQPAVDDALRKANHRANVDAWGSALRRGNGEEGDREDRSAWSEIMDVGFWRLRGLLFVTSVVLSLGMGVVEPLRPEMARTILDRRTLGIGTPLALLLYHALSVFWIAWDPYWLRKRRSRSRARVAGRATWLRNMAIIYCLRTSTAIWAYYRSRLPLPQHEPVIPGRLACLVEVALLVHALTSLKITAPVSTRPIQPVNLSVPPSPSAHGQFINTAPHPLASTGSERNIPNPMFGLPSFASTSTKVNGENVDGEYEPMDWEPSPSINRLSRSRPPGLDGEDEYDTTPRKNDWDTFAVNKQRMFPGKSEHDETGLESLIAGWGIGNSNGHGHNNNHNNYNNGNAQRGPGSTFGTGAPALQPRQAAQLSPSKMAIGELLVRVTSCILVIARIAALGAYSSGIRNLSPNTIDTVDKVLSGIEVGTIVMSAITLPRTYPSPRIAILAGDFILHMVYAVFQQQAGPLVNLPREPWMMGMTWGQWALLSATRVLL